LADLRGKVVVVTVIYATCADTCPLLTAKLVGIQRQLGTDGARVRFVAITVDPIKTRRRRCGAMPRDTERRPQLDLSHRTDREIARWPDATASTCKKRAGG
jgi:hypothetical protein